MRKKSFSSKAMIAVTFCEEDKIKSLAQELADAAYSRKLTRVKFLLNKGAPANTEKYEGFSEGCSALNGASRNGHAEIVKLLLEHDKDNMPDIESRGSRNLTPLQQAAYYGHADCAKVLFGYGASVTSKAAPCSDNMNAREIAHYMNELNSNYNLKEGNWGELLKFLDSHISN